MSTKYKMVLACIVIYIYLPSCKKLVEVEPPVTSLTGQNMFKSDATAVGILTGVYANLSNGSVASGLGGVSIQTGLSSDELTLWSGNTDQALQELYENHLSSERPSVLWIANYSFLHTVNSALEGVEKSTTLTQAIKQQLIGEGKFLRAFFHFYLVNIFGDVPLCMSSDWRLNATIRRTASSEVYQQIISDLKEAKLLLSSNFIGGDGHSISDERLRPNKSAASAMLARVYLYTGDWTNAELEASSVINNKDTYDTVPLNNVFLKESKEAIWQIQTVTSNYNTQDGYRFILTGAPNSTRPVYLNSFLLNSFEPGDKRFIHWVKSLNVAGKIYYYPVKYKVQIGTSIQEHLMILRLGEQYLIRAEARAQLNDISGAKADLNIIRSRAGLPSINANDKDALLSTIFHERQIELFTEWGNRWFDLKRTGNIDAVMGGGGVCAAKGGNWETSWQLYPLPYQDILLNPNLTQNPQY